MHRFLLFLTWNWWYVLMIWESELYECNHMCRCDTLDQWCRCFRDLQRFHWGQFINNTYFGYENKNKGFFLLFSIDLVSTCKVGVSDFDLLYFDLLIFSYWMWFQFWVFYIMIMIAILYWFLFYLKGFRNINIQHNALDIIICYFLWSKYITVNLMIEANIRNLIHI